MRKVCLAERVGLFETLDGGWEPAPRHHSMYLQVAAQSTMKRIDVREAETVTEIVCTPLLADLLVLFDRLADGY